MTLLRGFQKPGNWSFFQAQPIWCIHFRNQSNVHFFSFFFSSWAEWAHSYTKHANGSSLTRPRSWHGLAWSLSWSCLGLDTPGLLSVLFLTRSRSWHGSGLVLILVLSWSRYPWSSKCLGLDTVCLDLDLGLVLVLIPLVLAMCWSWLGSHYCFGCGVPFCTIIFGLSLRSCADTFHNN